LDIEEHELEREVDRSEGIWYGVEELEEQIDRD
jgi:hypothetical protein